MKLARHLPDLTVDELNRYWLNPIQVCDLAAIGQHRDPKVRRFLGNVSDAKMLPFRKSGPAKTAPRLYSLKSATMLRTMREVSASGRGYEFAGAIADKVATIMTDMVESVSHHDQVREQDQWLIVYAALWNGSFAFFELVKRRDFSISYLKAYDSSVFDAGALIQEALNAYIGAWGRDRVDRGVDIDQCRYAGYDDEGRPLDPTDPSNFSDDPVERARRRLEIEEYIAKRDEEEGAK